MVHRGNEIARRNTKHVGSIRNRTHNGDGKNTRTRDSTERSPAVKNQRIIELYAKFM